MEILKKTSLKPPILELRYLACAIVKKTSTAIDKIIFLEPKEAH